MKAIAKGLVTVLLASSALLMNAAHAENWMAIGVYPESVGSTLKGQTAYLDLGRVERNGDLTTFFMKSKLNPGLISFFSYPELISKMVVNCSNKTYSEPAIQIIGIKKDGEQVIVKETPASEIVFKDVGANSILENHWARFCSPKITSLQTTAKRELRPTGTVGSGTYGENWVGFGASLGGVPGTKGQPLYLDINAVERTGVFTGIWLKTEFVSVAAAADNIVSTIQRLIVDCGNNTFATEKIINVKRNGDRITVKDTAPKIADFKKVSPNFLGDNRWNLVCPAWGTSLEPPQPSVAQADTPSAVPDPSDFTTGSGFFVTSDGYFVTNYHVIAGAKTIALFDVNSKMHMARVVRVDKANDIAVLKAEGKFKAIPVVTSRTAKRGQSVITVGYPHANIQGLEPKVTGGIVNSLTGLNNDARTFQISVPLQSGNSGGPLVTLDGNVIGVVSMKLSAISVLKETGDLTQNVNYAVKSNYLTEVLIGIPGVERKLLPPSIRSYKGVAELTAVVEEATALVVSTSNASEN